MKRTSRFHRLIQTYLVWAAPFVIACMVWSSFEPTGQVSAETSFALRALWEILSWNLMLWFLVLIGFFGLLVASPSAREQTLKRIANIRDGDEREEWITGVASRRAYISTLSVLILLLFFSIFTLRIGARVEDPVTHEKRRTVAIGLSFKLFETRHETVGIKPAVGGEPVFESRDLPISKTGILLLLLMWQLGSFHATVRREL